MTPEEIENLNAQHVEAADVASVTAFNNRVQQYPDIKEQLDMLWHAVDTGLFGEDAKTSDFYTSLKSVKDSNPKPE